MRAPTIRVVTSDFSITSQSESTLRRSFSTSRSTIQGECADSFGYLRYHTLLRNCSRCLKNCVCSTLSTCKSHPKCKTFPTKIVNAKSISLTYRYADGRDITIWPRKNDRDSRPIFANERWVGVSAPLPTSLRYDFRVNVFVHHFRSSQEVCVAIDDISFSPSCFGLGVPANETREFPGECSFECVQITGVFQCKGAVRP